MPVYRYTAKNQQGGTVTGLVEAEDTRRAAGIVREMGLLLLDVRPERTAQVQQAEQVVMQKVVYPVYSGVSVRDLAVFYRQMATAVRAGIPVHRALISVAENTGKPRLRRVVQAVVNDLLAGKSLAQAMSKHPHVFDELQIALIQAGEEGRTAGQYAGTPCGLSGARLQAAPENPRGHVLSQSAAAGRYLHPQNPDTGGRRGTNPLPAGDHRLGGTRFC
jgi:hypothetical protein